jgi:hypothetical protein
MLCLLMLCLLMLCLLMLCLLMFTTLGVRCVEWRAAGGAQRSSRPGALRSLRSRPQNVCQNNNNNIIIINIIIVVQHHHRHTTNRYATASEDGTIRLWQTEICDYGLWVVNAANA